MEKLRFIAYTDW